MLAIPRKTLTAVLRRARGEYTDAEARVSVLLDLDRYGEAKSQRDYAEAWGWTRAKVRYHWADIYADARCWFAAASGQKSPPTTQEQPNDNPKTGENGAGRADSQPNNNPTTTQLQPTGPPSPDGSPPTPPSPYPQPPFSPPPKPLPEGGSKGSPATDPSPDDSSPDDSSPDDSSPTGPPQDDPVAVFREVFPDQRLVIHQIEQIRRQVEDARLWREVLGRWKLNYPHLSHQVGAQLDRYRKDHARRDHARSSDDPPGSVQARRARLTVQDYADQSERVKEILRRPGGAGAPFLGDS